MACDYVSFGDSYERKHGACQTYEPGRGSTSCKSYPEEKQGDEGRLRFSELVCLVLALAPSGLVTWPESATYPTLLEVHHPRQTYP